MTGTTVRADRCGHASSAGFLVSATRTRLEGGMVVTAPIAHALIVDCDALLRSLRMGRSRRRQFHAERVKLRALRALARALFCFWRET